MILVFLVLYYTNQQKQKKLAYGYFLLVGMFGKGKTSNMTSYLASKAVDQINITNYWTGYTDFQFESHKDLLNIVIEIKTILYYTVEIWDILELFEHKKSFLRKRLLGFRDFLREKVVDDEGEPIFEVLLKRVEELTRPIEVWQEEDENGKMVDMEAGLPGQVIYESLPGLLDMMRAYRYDKAFAKIRYNIAMDEGETYFDSREFAKNFAGENKGLMLLLTQPRHLNALVLISVQKVKTLEKKFRERASQIRYFFDLPVKIWKYYVDYYWDNDDDIGDFSRDEKTKKYTKAQTVGGGKWWGGYFDLWKIGIQYPKYKYNAKEIVEPLNDIYVPGTLIKKVLRVTPAILEAQKQYVEKKWINKVDNFFEKIFKKKATNDNGKPKM